MFEQLGLETLTAPQAALWFALALGCAFGALAQITRFCFRRMIDGTDRRQAAGIWLMALATATLGTQAAIAQGWSDFADHRFMVTDLPVLAIALGGLAFGAGMILTRGCVSRLTVLGASGNLRAVLVLVVFAVVAHATLKGVLSGLRTSVSAITIDLAPTLPGAPMLWAALIAGAAVVFAWRSGNGAGMLGLAALLGLLGRWAGLARALCCLTNSTPSRWKACLSQHRQQRPCFGLLPRPPSPRALVWG